jgi:AbrB family looped-hinge helix DNA binding protein
MNTIKIQQRGTLTLPKKIRESLNLSEGEVLMVSQDENRIILERAESPDAMLLRDIKNSLTDIKLGKFIEFGTISEFKKKLKMYGKN